MQGYMYIQIVPLWWKHVLDHDKSLLYWNYWIKLKLLTFASTSMSKEKVKPILYTQETIEQGIEQNMGNTNWKPNLLVATSTVFTCCGLSCQRSNRLASTKKNDVSKPSASLPSEILVGLRKKSSSPNLSHTLPRKSAVFEWSEIFNVVESLGRTAGMNRL